ncbi:MAG TPA: hypothetical protein VJ385_19035 [Fibrobacteria bacterium]|nr:hypothetical protein [Fibrobacteria bacterium]
MDIFEGSDFGRSVEVFKTDVENREYAKQLLDRIHGAFAGYRANFDLEDCDRILRVECATGAVQSAHLIRILEDSGFHAEVLTDDL